MGKVKKYISPPLFAICLFFSWSMMLIYPGAEKLDYGMLLIAIGIICYYYLILVPIWCIIYSKKIVCREKWKYLFGIYNALLSTVPSLILLNFSSKDCIYYLLIFLWVLVWSITPLVPEKEEENPTD